MEESIYGTYKESMEKIMQTLVEELEKKNNLIFQETGEKGYEHITARLKSDQSMRKKLLSKKLPIDTYHALRSLRDSIGLRIICSFRDDVYKMVDELKQMPEVEVIEEKDYIKKAKENGYRSYHMILEMTVPYEDVDGMDYQVLIEADFLVNLFEDGASINAVVSAEEKIFRTPTGIKLLKKMYFGE